MGNRTSGSSTGLTSKSAAKRYCMTLYRDGKLVPQKTETFTDFSKDFWVWDKCTYILRCNNLKRAKKSISIEHARTERGYLTNPYLILFYNQTFSSLIIRRLNLLHR